MAFIGCVFTAWWQLCLSCCSPGPSPSSSNGPSGRASKVRMFLANVILLWPSSASASGRVAQPVAGRDGRFAMTLPVVISVVMRDLPCRTLSGHRWRKKNHYAPPAAPERIAQAQRAAATQYRTKPPRLQFAQTICRGRRRHALVHACANDFLGRPGTATPSARNNSPRSSGRPTPKARALSGTHSPAAARRRSERQIRLHTGIDYDPGKRGRGDLAARMLATGTLHPSRQHRSAGRRGHRLPDEAVPARRADLAPIGVPLRDAASSVYHQRHLGRMLRSSCNTMDENCILTRSRTSTEPMPSSLAG